MDKSEDTVEMKSFHIANKCFEEVGNIIEDYMHFLKKNGLAEHQWATAILVSSRLLDFFRCSFSMNSDTYSDFLEEIVEITESVNQKDNE